MAQPTHVPLPHTVVRWGKGEFSCGEDFIRGQNFCRFGPRVRISVHGSVCGCRSYIDLFCSILCEPRVFLLQIACSTIALQIVHCMRAPPHLSVARTATICRGTCDRVSGSGTAQWFSICTCSGLKLSTEAFFGLWRVRDDAFNHL